MSVTEVNPSDHDQYSQYRAVCMSAVSTMVLGIISVPAILFSKLLFVPVFGIGLGVYALVQLKKHRDELTGVNLARIGLAICIVVLVTGTTYSGYIYATEVPDGYQRISFEVLKPEPGSRAPIPQSALALNGQRVFVKGYVHPGVTKRKGIKQFVLVPDMKTCCFGGQPALTDMIEVTLEDPLRVDYSYSKRRLAGVLRVSGQPKSVAGLEGVYYHLEADYAR